MAQIHFFTTTLNLAVGEPEQLAIQIEEALKAKGRPDDKVILTFHLTYQGSFQIEDAI